MSDVALSPLTTRSQAPADRLGPVSRYAVTLVMVGATVILAEAFASVLPAPSLTLFFVLPVVISATSFGWGPALVATASGVAAYDFFFTEPKFSFAIANPVDILDALLLLAVAAIVSIVAADARRKALAAERAAEQAEALRALAHTVIEARSDREIASAAASALQRIFHAPAVILAGRDGELEMLASAGVTRLGEADLQAARAAAETHVPVRAGAYPADSATLDFWPVSAAGGREVVLGIDLSGAGNGRPAGSEGLIEMVGGYLAAAPRR